MSLACEQCFNSTLVQLKETDREAYLMEQIGFNSTLVQLKVTPFTAC